MALIKKFLKKFILNEELEVSHRLMNIILLTGMLVLPVCLFFDLISGAASGTAIPLFLIFMFFSAAFYLANVKKKFNLAGIILTVVSTNVLLPYLYFKGGGLNSSIPSWFILSSLFAWLLVRGWPCIAIFVSNIIVYAFTFTLEYRHPELVESLPDEQSVFFDVAFGIYLVILMLGLIFKFQNRLYEKKKKELEEKEIELMEANERLERLSEAKSMFLASMSHEIRTPINAIVGMNEMILRESDNNNISGYSENIEVASGTLLSIVNDILDFSKIEAGLMEIIPDEYEMFSVLNDCYTLLEMRASDKGLTLVIENDKDIPSKLCGDEVRIRQILINLLTNAVKYTDTGTITVKAGYEKTDDDDTVVIRYTVADTGRGMSEKGMEHLFDSYARVDEKKNRNIEGTGLGLAITKQLLDLMNGSIEVKSKPGEGTTFKVSIPQKVVSKEPMGVFTERRVSRSKAISRHAAGFKAPDARILVTDDVKMNLKVITMLLKDTEMHVDTASDGMECIERYKAEHYDIVLLDHMMPGMDGIETLRVLKESDRYKKEQTPIIALTANAMLGAEKIYLDTGFDDYLTKPCKVAELEAMIVKHLPESMTVHPDTQ